MHTESDLICFSFGPPFRFHLCLQRPEIHLEGEAPASKHTQLTSQSRWKWTIKVNQDGVTEFGIVAHDCWNERTMKSNIKEGETSEQVIPCTM